MCELHQLCTKHPHLILFHQTVMLLCGKHSALFIKKLNSCSSNYGKRGITLHMGIAVTYSMKVKQEILL